MNNEIKIREATIADLPGIKKLVNKSLLPFGFKYDHKGSEHDYNTSSKRCNYLNTPSSFSWSK